MGGCETTLEISRTQLSDGGLTGGRILKTEIMSASSSNIATTNNTTTGITTISTVAIGVSREIVNKKAVKILRDELITSKCALPLLLFIAQYRTKIAYQSISNNNNEDDNDNHLSLSSKESLKFISYLYDICQDVSMQYTEFLMQDTSMFTSILNNNNISNSNNTSSTSFSSLIRLIPSFESLLYDYSLSIPVVFQLVRPLFRATLINNWSIANKSLTTTTTTTINNNNTMSDNEYLLQNWNPFSTEILTIIYKYHESKINILINENIGENNNNNNNILSIESLWKYISPELYMIFWVFTNSDISIPIERYELEIKKLKEKNNDLTNKLNKLTLSSSTNFNLTTEDIEINRNNIKLIKQEIKRVTTTLSELTLEFITQKQNIEKMLSIIDYYKNQFILINSNTNKFINNENVNETILQYCIIDRMLMSPLDATYCSQFISHLNSIITPNFYFCFFWAFKSQHS